MDRFNFKFQGYWNDLNSCYFELFAAGIGLEFVNNLDIFRKKVATCATAHGCVFTVSEPIYMLNPTYDRMYLGASPTIGVATIIVTLQGAKNEVVKDELMRYLPL